MEFLVGAFRVDCSLLNWDSFLHCGEQNRNCPGVALVSNMVV